MLRANEAAKAAKNTFSPGRFIGWQIKAATITEINVIRKFIGLISLTSALSFSVKSFKVLMIDWSKLTKRKRIFRLSQYY